MGGVAFGSPVSSDNTNSAFLEKNADDVTVGIVGLENTNSVASGGYITNTQAELNALNAYVGKTPNTGPNGTISWTNNDVGSTSDTVKARAEALTREFSNSVGVGHTHDGTDGNGGIVDAVSIGSVQLKGVLIQGTNITGAVGASTDVSSLMSGQTPSTGTTSKGIVVTNPYNRCAIRNTNDQEITDGSGNEVYGRLTYASSVWTLSYFVDSSGSELSYPLPSAITLKWYYQQLINPISDAGFTYSPQLVTPSGNTTADVAYATTTAAGKVLLSSTAPANVTDTPAIGSSSTVALADHVHQGVGSVKATGGTAAYGDIELSPGTGMTITQSGKVITFTPSTSGIGKYEGLAGPVNGTNTTFGPFSLPVAGASSVLLMLDGLPVDPSLWSLSGSSVVFATAPTVGQVVTAFYLTMGTIIIPTPPSGTLQTDFHTITTGEAAAKLFTLSQTPATPGFVLVDVCSGSGKGSRIFNVDYTITSNQFRWSGYALDGVLAAGDVIRFHYQY